MALARRMIGLHGIAPRLPEHDVQDCLASAPPAADDAVRSVMTLAQSGSYP